MGASCGCCSTREEKTITSNKQKLKKNDSINSIKLQNNSIYNYNFKNNNFNIDDNIIIFTANKYIKNQFITLNSLKKETIENSTYKGKSLAISYSKGYKIDCPNQDKFFILIDSDVEVYVVLDGHGPYGHKIAHFVEEFFFEKVSNWKNKEDINCSSIELFIKNVFTECQNNLNSKILKEIDCYLSGVSITMIIKKGSLLYSANVGNVLAFIYFSEKIFTYKFEVRQLSFDDSKINLDNFEELNIKNNNYMNAINNINNNSTGSNNNYVYYNTNNLSSNRGKYDSEIKNDNNFNKTIKNIHGNLSMEDEVRRIYENGGEVRKLAGERIWRIFLKGKYFPGLICTRSLGDLIGREIGVISTPHIVKYQCDERYNYYLIMCTDGISNNVTIDKMVSIIEANDLLPLESINSIMLSAKNYFRKVAYCPDMTIFYKSLDIKKTNLNISKNNNSISNNIL